MPPMQSDESNVTNQGLSAMTQLAELLRQPSEAGQNASRALAQMRRAYLPAGSFRKLIRKHYDKGRIRPPRHLVTLPHLIRCLANVPQEIE
jgi:hypothetical protein